jgi:hypothetical protein
LLAVLANVVVLGALFRAAEHLVGFVGLFEFVLGALLFADVRMILARQLAVGGLEFLVVSGWLDAKNLVIVFEIHLTITHSDYPAPFRAAFCVENAWRAGCCNSIGTRTHGL